MSSANDYLVGETAWCPGCGNFAIREALAAALAELKLPPHRLLICSGIGQAAKIPHYLKANGFNGLHGRALPLALGARIANKELTVIVESGDGDSYGEGGNHFIHNVRRNPNLAHLVHNNQVYGLTKGQASPTSDMGMVTGVQTGGVVTPALNPLALALVLGAGFIARCFSGEKEQLQATIKAAIEFPGYALVDILQPCVSFNKVNTHGWYKERIYFPEIDDEEDWNRAMEFARQWGEKIPLGIFYRKPRPVFEATLKVLEGEPLAFRAFDPVDLAGVQDEFL
ncbi:MAG: 2-oxoacid:ferredoxin oxidoreductase subunit beta [Clostridia bacterium]|nr:2-oxoacid:ferredoxin oxidoreductase subunit beta [Clostridia bacterium]